MYAATDTKSHALALAESRRTLRRPRWRRSARPGASASSAPTHRESSLRVALAEECDLRDFEDVLAALPAKRPPLSDVVRNLGRLKPRLYTLASSPRVHPGEAHFTVELVPRGVASTWLAEKLPVGGAVRAFVNRGRPRLPRQDTPVAMIGAGTGIAVFRAFLQEREAVGASGWSWLFFGGARQADDLHRAEVDRFLATGVLTRLVRDRVAPRRSSTIPSTEGEAPAAA